MADVTLSVPSLAIASAAKMCATTHILADEATTEAEGETYGIVRFFANTVPTANLTGKLDAIQLDDEEEESE